MGCGASSAIHRDPALTRAALSFGQQFELTTPMLVMPFGVFKAQGHIMKSTKAWRDEALAAGSLVEHKEGSSQVVIFISHTWWDRSFTDATNDPNNPNDVGAPDLQADYPDEQREDIDGCIVTYQRPKNLKWRVICAGVQVTLTLTLTPTLAPTLSPTLSLSLSLSLSLTLTPTRTRTRTRTLSRTRTLNLGTHPNPTLPRRPGSRTR